MSVDAGVIYQKGYLLQVNSQSIIISPYSNQPNGISIGFNALESIVTSYQDPSLLDNSQGVSNYAAPGADRLKISPILTIRNSNSVSTNDFFSIVDFVAGSPSIVNQNTEYAALGDKLAQISYETNGNFIVNPFNIRVIENLLANGSIDTFNNKIEIDAGLAYVDGYRVQILGKLLNIIPKGTNILFAPSQILTTQMGNYLQCKEFSGYWNPTLLQQVSLRSAPAYSISNNMAIGIGSNSILAPGSQIGTATLLAVAFDNGTPGLSSCVYDIYLFNIQMNSGQNFQSVRSLYVTSGSNKGFADIILGPGNSVNLIDSSTSPLIYDFNQSAIATLKTSSNTIDTQFQYFGSSNVSFSSSGSVTITLPTIVGGVNQLPFGVGNLATPQKEEFLITCEGTVTTANIAGSVTTYSNTTVSGVSTTFNTSLYPGAYIQIANSTVSEIKQVISIANNTSLTLASSTNNSFASANVSIAYQTGMEIPTSGSNVVITIVSTNTFTISLNQTFSGAFNGSVLYPIQRTVASPAQKLLNTQLYVKIDLANSVGGTTGPWSLGLPDVYAISNVWYGSTYSTSNPSITNNFRLNDGQTDQYYGLSYLTPNNVSLLNTNVLLIELEAYTQSISTGAGFFSVDSYPIDDTGVAANSIFTADIDVYTSIANSSVINLRNAADFRFYAQNTIPYISNVTLAIANTAIINPSNVVSFSTSNLFIPIPDAEFESSIQYYVGRIDTVGLDIKGNVIINSGVPSENPTPAPGISTGITLAQVNVPPYPTLTSDIIDGNESLANPPVSLTYISNKRYTMADIGVLDSRITEIEYYTALSLLEQSAQNLQLTNANGNTLFKNGMIADPFNDFSISNTLDPAFNIAIDSINSEAKPTFSQFLVNLEYANSLSSSVQISNDNKLILLDYSQNNTPFITQPFASQVRNCAQDTLYIWTGDISLNPEGDYQPDVTVNPTVVVTINAYANWIHLANAWGTQWGAWNETQNTITTTTPSVGGGSTTTTSTTTNSTRQGLSLSTTPVTNIYNLGDVITNVAIQPYAREALIQFRATGLKPSTQFWAFLDDISVSNNCVQTSNTYVIANTAVPGTLISNSLGALYGLFYLPANTFHTGTLNFQLLDISNLTTESNIITSSASQSYYATNLAYTVNDLQINRVTAKLRTRILSQSMSVTSNVVTTTLPPVVATNPAMGGTSSGTSGQGGSTAGGGNGPGGDPLAQSFSILASQVPQNVQGVFLNSIDLFFESTDPNLGITFMIRNMTNGYPDSTIISGSKVYLTAANIKTSPNASAVTNIVFPEPVYLDVGSQYCFVLMPDGCNPNYNIWTGVQSAKDIITGAPIYALSSTGNMFLSAQNSTWTPYQKESVKFNLYLTNFTALGGTAVFTNDDSEFLAIANTSRVFTMGENVYYSNTVLLASNVSVSNTSNNVACVTTGILAGTCIYIQSNTNNSTMVANVVSVSSGTSLVINSIPTFTDSNASMGMLTSNGGLTGKITYVNTSFIMVSNSTANSTVFLAVNNGIIIGSSSLASASIANLNNIMYDTIMPKFLEAVPSVCSIQLKMTGTGNTYTSDGITTPLTYGQSTDFIDEERIIASKSNEMKYMSGNKSLTISGVMNSISSYESPSFYMGKAGALAVYNLVNADDTNLDVFTSEITNNGEAINRYISLTTTLATGLEAEAFVVYVGAYWPPDANIYVYCKLANQYDSTPYNQQSWSPMVTTNPVRSSAINVEDLNEYIFSLPNNAPLYSNSNYLNTAYYDANGIVAYTSNSGAFFETFNTFAVKIVLLSNNSCQIPRLMDMRGIATTTTL